MNNYMYDAMTDVFPGLDSMGLSLMFIIIVWSLFWKGLALWHSGRKAEPVWFVVLLVVNTMGILEIIYLFGVLKLKLSHLFRK